MPRPSYGILALLATLSACSWSHSHMSMSTNDAIIESGSDQPTFVAWYHDGDLLGADAVAHPDFPYRDWVRQSDREVLDHPDLGRWRGMLERLQQVAGGTASVDEVLDCTAGLPFCQPVERALLAWTDGRGERAAALLDHAREFEVRDAFAADLVQTATAADARVELVDERLAAWLRALIAADHDEAAALVLGCNATGVATARMALAQLDDFSSKTRAQVFRAAALRLTDDPLSAATVVEAADELRSSTAAEALLDLMSATCSTELARQVLRKLDDRRTSDRPRLFAQAAALAIAEPRAQYAIADGIRELSSSDRLDAALVLVRDGAVPRELLVLLVDRTDDLPSRDRAEFLLAVLDSQGGADDRVREACRHAAERKLTKSSRDRVLQKLGN